MSYERVAIVHDWLTSMRGGERVVEALYRVFPRADLFTLTWDPARLSPALARRTATTSAIHRVARAPFMDGRFRALLPFFPLAVESFKLDGYDLVVSSSHCVAIGAIAPPTALHVAYVHSTLRYVREGQPIYEASVPGGRVGRAMFRGAAHYLRRWETAAAARPHELIANSSYTRERILRYYGRDARVIEPPVETARFERASANAAPRDERAPFLVVSALVPNKRVDLALRAFQGRAERLVVVGDGPERRRLEPLLGPNVTWLPRVDEAELAALCAGCRALLHPGVDDFGMVMVEALAAGKPVIACAEGGALDIVRDGETGLLIESPTVQSVRAALDRFARLRDGFDPGRLRASAKRFDSSHFERRFAEAVEEGFRRRRDRSSESSADHRSTMRGAARSGTVPISDLAQAASRRNGGTHGGAHHPLPVSAATNAAGVAPNGATKSGGARNANGRRHLPVLTAAGVIPIEAAGSSRNGHAATGGPSFAGAVLAMGTSGLPPDASDLTMATSGPSLDASSLHAFVNPRAFPSPNGSHGGHTSAADYGGFIVRNGANGARHGGANGARSDGANGASAGVSRALHERPASGVDPALVRQRLAKHSSASLRAKRAADVVVAASGLVVAAPLVVVLGALIPLTSPGPALFYQRRTGLHQRPFVLVKLRTMDRRGRVTALGRLLRPLGLDELPQLWNVLKGEMSVVGPRPELPELVAQFEHAHPGFHLRHLVRPGITGWAQVNGLRGHPDLSIAERLRFDLHYMCEWDLAFDARILARTFSTVLKDTLESFRR
ncbi:MAG TPA: sugar transferase [Polyangiaceae bacterium]|nr:sugar transferase [Polyangiaceae bacterium]